MLNFQDNLNSFDDFFLQTIVKILNIFIYISKILYFWGEAEVMVFITLLGLGILYWRRLCPEAKLVATCCLTVLPVEITKILASYCLGYFFCNFISRNVYEYSDKNIAPIKPKFVYFAAQ